MGHSMMRLFVAVALTISLGWIVIEPRPANGQVGHAIDEDPGIGRLNHTGFRSRAHCTAFAMENGAILSAAHCLPQIATDIVHILLGYEVDNIVQHVKTPGSFYRTIQERDIAVLCSSGVFEHGFHLAPLTPDVGAKVDVQGYSAPRVHALQKTACSIDAIVQQDSFVVLDCSVPSGTSGAPVTVSGTRKVVGIVSASSSRGTLVTRVTDRMLNRLCEYP